MCSPLLVRYHIAEMTTTFIIIIILCTQAYAYLFLWQAFNKNFAKMLGEALEKRTDLQLDIMSALRTLVNFSKNNGWSTLVKIYFSIQSEILGIFCAGTMLIFVFIVVGFFNFFKNSALLQNVHPKIVVDRMINSIHLLASS